MNRRTLLGYALLCLTGTAAGITPTSAQTTSTVIGSGAILASHGETRLTATIGQPAIGLTAATSTEASQGFWYSRTTAQPSDTREATASVLTLTSAPNPLSRSTTLTFTVPAGGHVSLVIYNEIGEIVRTLINEERDAGTATENADLSDLPAGHYTAVLSTGGRRGSISLILVD